MVEAIVLWNEPNNLSHWNFHLDPEWKRFAEMVRQASVAIRSVNPDVPIVLGGVSSCDCDFLRLMTSYGLMEYVDAVGVHGFPLDWNHWQLTEWPDRVAEAHAITGKPIWVTETGAKTPRLGPAGVCTTMAQRLRDYAADPRVKAVFQYTLREDDLFPTGLVSTDLTTAYPALRLWQSWSARGSGVCL